MDPYSTRLLLFLDPLLNFYLYTCNRMLVPPLSFYTKTCNKILNSIPKIATLTFRASNAEFDITAVSAVPRGVSSSYCSSFSSSSVRWRSSSFTLFCSFSTSPTSTFYRQKNDPPLKQWQILLTNLRSPTLVFFAHFQVIDLAPWCTQTLKLSS